MSFGWIDAIFEDPRGMLIFLLLALPGRFLAISAHEAAHGWMAERCGDPTARYMGRVTLNPLKHLDPIGLLCMLFLGIGWAKPVPVNPLNFRNYRRDDLKVSLAGIVTNLFLFLSGSVLMYGTILFALSKLPHVSFPYAVEGLSRATYQGMNVLLDAEYYYPLSEYFMYPLAFADLLITPVFGQTAGYLFEMLFYFVVTNLMLAIFNLIPVPPLDGYHVLNDLVLKRPLFADAQAQRVGMVVLYALMFTGLLSDGLSWVDEQVFTGLSHAVMAIARGIGLY